MNHIETPSTGEDAPVLPRRMQWIGVAAASLSLIVLSWISLNFFTYQRLFTDSGIFAATALHMSEGKVLYKDVWDHKPPLIYFINLPPVAWDGGSVVSIRFFERFYAVAGTLAFFFVLLWTLDSLGLAFLGAVGLNLHFFYPELIQGGNLTEEYAAWFVNLGLLAVVAARKPAFPHRLLFSGLAGLFFSLAVFAKEPFLLTALPWFLYLVWKPDGGRIINSREGLLFLAGSLLPALVFFVLFLVQDNLADWFDVLSYNFAYAAHSNVVESQPLVGKLLRHIEFIFRFVLHQTWSWLLVFILGLAACFHLPFVRRYRYFPWFCALAFLLEFYATMISGYKIQHYYLQFVYSYILIGIFGLVFLIHLFRETRLAWFLVVGIFLLAQFTVDFTVWKSHIQRLSVPRGNVNIGPISRRLQSERERGATLWIGRGANSRYYTESGLLSPVKNIYLVEHLFLDTRLSTAGEKREQLLADLRANPPTYIVANDGFPAYLKDLGLGQVLAWFQASYEPVPFLRDQDNLLYRLKGTAP